jgi:hypothetical protein
MTRRRIGVKPSVFVSVEKKIKNTSCSSVLSINEKDNKSGRNTPPLMPSCGDPPTTYTERQSSQPSRDYESDATNETQRNAEEKRRRNGQR